MTKGEKKWWSKDFAKSMLWFANYIRPDFNEFRPTINTAEKIRYETKISPASLEKLQILTGIS